LGLGLGLGLKIEVRESTLIRKAVDEVLIPAPYS
jgi:hypothetical protein